MKRFWIGLAAWMSLHGAAPAMAQEAQEAETPAMVEALVVNARTPGPAWWSVSKGDAKVWVLGLSGDLPRGAKWETEPFERRLKQTRRLIRLEDGASVRFKKAEAAFVSPWIGQLSAAQRLRLETAAQYAGYPVERYAALKPDIAALLLTNDVFTRAGIAWSEPAASLGARAKALRARDRKVGGSVKSGLKTSLKAGSSTSLTCITAALDRLEQPQSLRQSGEAWMRGDVRYLVAKPLAYNDCDLALKDLAAARERQIKAFVDEIAATLDGGKGAVALVGLTPLLMQSGVLDRLKARGYTVRTPGDLAG